MEKEEILIIDFGGQYNQLIARRVREQNVFCEVVPHTISIEKIKEKNPRGIIFTGGPSSIYDEDAPKDVWIDDGKTSDIDSLDSFNYSFEYWFKQLATTSIY